MKMYISTVFGNFQITYDNGALTSLALIDEGDKIQEMSEDVSEFAKKTAKEINEYALGKRKNFDIPLSPKGTPFMKSVWEELLSIPYGKTATYKEIANKISKPKSARAVGMACGKNPIILIIPCHRVVGKKGLVGYACGLEMKKKLLDTEKTNSEF